MGALLPRPSRRNSSPGRGVRRPHPDDVLKRLAREGRGNVGPTIYVGRSRPFDAYRAFALTLFGLILLVGGIGALPFVLPHNEITVSGLQPRTFLSPASLREVEVFFSVKPASALANLRVRVDGEPATVIVEGKRLRWVPPPLAEGRHRITLQSGSRFLWRGPSRASFTVDVDSVSPTLDVAAPAGPVTVEEPLVVKGTVEKDATVRVNGRKVPVVDGAFTYRFATPPIGLVRYEATDRAGNVTVQERPSGLALPPIRGVHVSLTGWVTPTLKEGVLALADERRINTVVLDLKDESGHVDYRSALTKVNDLGAGSGDIQYDLRAAINELHARGIRVMGRIVTFRDPVYVRASQNAGRFDDIVQTHAGDPYPSTTGPYLNPASTAVQDYLINLIGEAADAGVDDVLLDYVRRPEGPLSLMVFPGIANPTVSELDVAYTSFVERAKERLARTRTRLGVSVFGVAAKHPDRVAQNVAALARHVDYVAPMLYPSHFITGSYNVVDPPNQPYEIVSRAIPDFASKVVGTDAAILPWLQDFSLAPGRTYGATEVRAQITAAREQLTPGFLVWDPKVTYTSAAFPADAPTVPVPAAGATSGSAVAPTVPPTLSRATPSSTG